MLPAETLNALHGGVGRPAWLRPVLLAGVVRLALSAVAFGGGDGDGLVIRSGGAELRSASPREVGRVPVVFVHGMLGGPGNWSAMIDRLAADPAVRERYQFLTFGYDCFQPIPESARELLEALAETRRRSDPEGRDDSFDRVVLVGHSLGGLVAKAATARASDPHRARDADPPPDGHGMAIPRVGRIIFVATPHRGTAVDRGALRSVGDWFAQAVSPALAEARGREVAVAGGPVTSIDQLTWDHPLLADLGRAWDAGKVPCHSIIAALGDPTAEGATDGVVPVVSARLGDARSELVVRTHHLCYRHPQVIREVRTILIDHAAPPARRDSDPDGRRPATPPGPLATAVPVESTDARLRREADLPRIRPTDPGARPARPGVSRP